MSDDPRWAPPGDDSPQIKPPTVPQAELAVLGAVLMKPAVLDLLAGWLLPEHFGDEATGALWGLYLQHHDRQAPIQLPALLEPYRVLTGWEMPDVKKALARIAGGTITTHGPQVVYYGEQVRDAWIRRRVIEVAQEMLAAANRPAAGAAGILNFMEGQLSVLTDPLGNTEHACSLADAMGRALDQAHAAAALHEAGELVGVGSGIGAVDRKLGGWRDTDLIIVGSRPGMGKSSFSNCIARAAAEQFLAKRPESPRWVATFSLEMGGDQLALRALCAEARISFERVRLGHATATDLINLAKAKTAMDSLPIWIEDKASVSVSAIRRSARRIKRQRGLGLIIIDYLQLVDVAAEERKEAGGNRVQEVSYITRALKRLAKDLQVPVVCLCQLNRDLEKREDKRPQLSDLRESGTIEQDADIVAFLYRDHYYLVQRPPAKREKEKELDYGLRRSEWAIAVDKSKDTAEFMIAKNRHGAGGTLALRFIPEMMLFEDDTPGDATQGDTRKQQLAMDLMHVS